MNAKTQITKQRLRNALQRLLDGKPERTKADSKISLSRINNEAGCSHGLIYKYPEVISEAKVAIEQHKINQQRNNILESLSTRTNKETRLKAECDKQEKLKRDYRDQRDNLQVLADNAVRRENALLFRCHELQLELNLIKNTKVVPLHDKG
ncbi:hypothetical protein IU367_07695 [Aeromonas bestiarum]|uniref:hypothetical protein n=1 Tax=Aeromonas bestiarum TaxID=105751 RepID=UPI0023784829|nr:hypothetical protein [Aeromonas bestiarum]WDL84051.1 hypothetical protein IU367_07695 [Aeromonas bestiarum]